MQRIAILGAGGAGKTLLARQLGQLLSVPVTHLDQLRYDTDWNLVDEEAFTAAQHELVARNLLMDLDLDEQAHRFRCVIRNRDTKSLQINNMLLLAAGGTLRQHGRGNGCDGSFVCGDAIVCVADGVDSGDRLRGPRYPCRFSRGSICLTARAAVIRFTPSSWPISREGVLKRRWNRAATTRSASSSLGTPPPPGACRRGHLAGGVVELRVDRSRHR
jgi:hypothetical protein